MITSIEAHFKRHIRGDVRGQKGGQLEQLLDCENLKV